MTDMKKTLCAVGDSFVFGAELVTTHYPDEFKHLNQEDLTRLEYEFSKLLQHRHKYYKLLDEMRFTSLMAKQLGYNHINFAQSGASQEGIKFQANLLLSHLKKHNLDPTFTEWVVGLTVPSRVMRLLETHDNWHQTLIERAGDSDYVWSKYTTRSIFPGDLEDSHNDFSKSFTREYLLNFSTTNYLISWAMHVGDIANLLRCHGVKKFIFVGLFPTLKWILDKNLAPESTVKKVFELLEASIEPTTVYPPDYDELGKKLNIHLTERCKGGHYTREGNKIIANHLVRCFK
jgi:hypothetical protein